MKTTIKYVGLVLSLLLVGNTYAYHDLNAKSKGKDKGNDGFMNKANCSPATSKLIFEFNDVRAQLNTNGVLFYDRAGRVAGYEVPKTSSGPKLRAIFAASLWMGGTDVNGQLKLAAAKFGDGNDFWTGPLTVTPNTGNYNPQFPVGDDAIRDFGDANIDPSVCVAYDKFFTIRKAEVISFITWWEYNKNPVGEEIPSPSHEVLARIYAWPAHGDVSLKQDFYLAPFYDRGPQLGEPGDGIYNPLENGDYPWYDDILGRDDIACGSDRRISLFGDETHWWIFNDKGNIHTESTGDPIGMEIRAQAFAFTTNDEVNKMTFYNYEMINRGTQTLFNTYFAQYVDADLGGAFDDYVGCDVSRGLGYAYNGDNFDADYEGNAGYGSNPPAIGVDFFEGPYQDADTLDNYGPHSDTINGVITPAVMNVQDAINGKGIVYKGLGIGYNDGIIDNERYGMKRFCYYTNQPIPAPQADPTTAAQYYNYMSGFWRFGDDVIFGGTGFGTGIHADYVFPSDSDPLFWSTAGQPTSFPWAENNTDGNGGSTPPGDRRFVQSAGPFTLKPGAINNITVGIVYARSTEGDLFASVRALRRADTKAQALFDNCFEILDPPNAPVLKIQELENELILMLENPTQSNNRNEGYATEDKINIIDPGNGTIYDKFYRFEGYQIFQMKDQTASASDLEDIDKARLVAQCDIINGVSTIMNYEYDEELGVSVPNQKVKGENKGIRHTFNIKEDLFAQGVRKLVNHKKYYYIAVAYAFNEFKKYNPDDGTMLDGQKIPYIASRINADGSSIRAKEAIPHNPTPELGGTKQNISYGSSPQITRLDGHGNGNRALEFTTSTLNKVITQGFAADPTYDYGAGPLNVKVVDPLNLVGGYFVCKFRDYVIPSNTNEYYQNNRATDTASWTIYRYDREDGELLDFVESERTIINKNEQVIAKWGISVEILQTQYYKGSDPTVQPAPSLEYDRYTAPISSSISFGDSSKRWLSFVNDNDSYFPTNWILSGTYTAIGADTITNPAPYTYTSPYLYNDQIGKDPTQSYEKLLSGGIAPHSLVGYKAEFSPLYYPIGTGALSTSQISQIRNKSSISRAPSIDIVITNDRSKWTRCAVIELGRDAALNVGQAKPGTLRKSPSRDINGNQIAGTGMGWFPGYAIDLETGMRLHMAFGENSFLGSDGGDDMIWNPSSRLTDNTGRPVMGGQQPIYVYGYNINGDGCPYYDGNNNWVYDRMAEATSSSYEKAFMSLTWVANTLLTAGQTIRSTDVKLKVRINKEYNEFTATGDNGGRPMYSWKMDDIRTTTGSRDQLAEALKMINVVPNPYLAFSTYETTRLDVRVKITNLPDQCVVKIYNVSGKLIRTFKKDSPVTSLDWDLKNNKGIPIASGVYLIHVQVEGLGDQGERIIKFFGGIRQPDLENI